MLLECHERLKNNPDTPPARLNETVTALVQLYDSMSDPTKAAEWRAKLEGEGTEARRDEAEGDRGGSAKEGQEQDDGGRR